jgi:hypothetical protein
MESASAPALSLKDKKIIKGLVQEVHDLRYINIKNIYEDIEGIITSMSKEELSTAIKNFSNNTHVDDDSDSDDFDAYYESPVRQIRSIIFANMMIEKDLSEIESEMDERIIYWLNGWVNN